MSIEKQTLEATWKYISKNIILNTKNTFVQMLKKNAEREILFYNFYLIKNANMPASLN